MLKDNKSVAEDTNRENELNSSKRSKRIKKSITRLNISSNSPCKVPQDSPINSAQNVRFPSNRRLKIGNLGDLSELLKRSKFLEKIAKSEVKQDGLQILSNRIISPSLADQGGSEVERLKALCSKLQNEQEVLKEQLSNQKNVIKKLQSNFTPTKVVSVLSQEHKLRVSTRRNSPIYEQDRRESPKIISEQNFGRIFENSESPKMREEGRLPFLFGPGSEKKIGNLSPLKYYRDKPVISKHFRIPKDVFVVKQ